MLDVLELEKRWLRYRLKKLIPLVTAAAILFIAGGTTSYLYVSNPQIFTEKASDKEVAPGQTKLVQTSVKPIIDANKSIEVATVQPEDEQQNILKPSFNFMYNIEDQVINYNNAKAENEASKAVGEVTEKPIKSVSPVQTKQAKNTTSKPKKKKSAKKPDKATAKPKPEKKPVATKQIKRVVVEKNKPVVKKSAEDTLVQISHEQVSEDELNSVVKRFNKQNNPALSLFIAKTYYDRGNYKEAYNYALVTNNLNPNIEDSVLIFARSLVKLGRKEDAIKTLDAYIGNTSSINAKILLNEIQKGKFK